VPFFLAGGTALGLGRGEIVRPLCDFGDFPVLVAVPDFRVSTAEAFGRVGRILTPARGQISIYRFCGQGVRETGRRPILQNDLERAVLPAHPEIGRLVRRLQAAGAAAAAMTGSGSAVFGIFAGTKGASRAFRDLTGSSKVARAWLGRMVGAAEYSTRVLKGGAASPRL
jgi:4-diphosphocytidyl-2-C-methyl-D-erythritol kinase